MKFMVNDCDKCKLKQILKKATKDAKETQEYYLAQVKKVNETLAKYNQKIDELEKGSK